MPDPSDPACPVLIRYCGVSGPHHQPATEVGPAFTFWRVILPNGLHVGRIGSERQARAIVAATHQPGATVADVRRAWDSA